MANAMRDALFGNGRNVYYSEYIQYRTKNKTQYK